MNDKTPKVSDELLNKLDADYSNIPGSRVTEFETVSDDFVCYITNKDNKTNNDTEQLAVVNQYNIEIQNIKMEIINNPSIVGAAIEKLSTTVEKPVEINPNQEIFYNKIIAFKSENAKAYSNILGSFIELDNKYKIIKIDENSNLWNLLCENNEAKEAYNRNIKGKANEDSENSRTPDSKLIINCFITYIKSSKESTKSISDNFEKDRDRLIKIRGLAEKEKNGNTNKIAFDNEFNKMLQTYEGQEDKIEEIKKYAFNNTPTGTENIIGSSDDSITGANNGLTKEQNIDIALDTLDRESKHIPYADDEEVVTNFQVKSAQLKNQITKEYGLEGPMYILETADMNGLQVTSMKPVDLFDKKTLDKIAKGTKTISAKGLDDWSEHFTDLFWYKVTGIPTLKIGKRNQNAPSDKKYKLNAIRTLFLAKDELIANDIRVGLEGTNLSAEDLWVFDDNFRACKNLTQLYLTYNLAVSAITQEAIKTNNDPNVGKFTALCRGLFNHFKSLNEIIIGDKKLTRNDTDIDLCERLDGKLKIDRLRRIEDRCQKEVNAVFSGFRQVGLRDVQNQRALDADEKLTKRDLKNNKKAKKTNDSFTNGISSFFGGNNSKNNINNKNTTPVRSVINTVTGVILAPLRLAGSAFRFVARLFFG